jgi:tryptophanyl-tRNA synthetase
MAAKELVFSGVQPTGNLHLGNYLGAIVNFVKLQDTHNCIYCVVDLHAITVWQDPAELTRNIREVTAAFIAAGIDPKKHIVFNQSQVSEHAELAWVFNCVARLGWLNRMTQFKEKAGKDRENASVGLYAYPNLMAADILVYRATHVPVGEDQKQHLELSRDIAQKFNNDFSDSIGAHNFGEKFFPLPEPLIRSCDAGDVAARRLQENVEVRRVGLFAHQSVRRCRRHCPEGAQGEDRSRALAERGKGTGGTPRGRQSGRHLCRAVGTVEAGRAA